MGTGVKREYFGDIISDGENWQVFVASEISHFVQTQVDKIGNVSVRLEETKYTELIVPKDGWSEERETVSSLRLDTVISAVYNISRQRSKTTHRVWQSESQLDRNITSGFYVGSTGYRINQRIWAYPDSGLEGTTKRKS